MKITFEQLQKSIEQCHACPLCQTRTHVVISDGNSASSIMFVGEGPGENEDLQGIPFVGRAGQLFDRMLHAISLTRNDIYICNVVKCRPPHNRTPSLEEVQTCLPYLRAQFLLIQPKIIVCLGATAGKAILSPQLRITRERGKWTHRNGVWILPTYHPAALLRDEAKKQDAWLDMQAIQNKIQELNLRQ